MLGRRVFVYRNLSNRKGRYSIQSREGMDYGLVIGHSDALVLENCIFKVSEAGRQRVLRDKRKNVHAGILGYISNKVVKSNKKVSYNPYTASGFMARNGRMISKAKNVMLSVAGVYYVS